MEKSKKFNLKGDEKLPSSLRGELFSGSSADARSRNPHYTIFFKKSQVKNCKQIVNSKIPKLLISPLSPFTSLYAPHSLTKATLFLFQ
jgi:hypothetical protein